MALIKKETGIVDRTPIELDTTAMQSFDTQRQNQRAFEEKQQLQEEKFLSTQLESAATAVYKNGYELYANDQKEYEKFVSKGLKELYSILPDSDAKTNTMAKVSITGSIYNTKVEKNIRDINEKQKISKIKENNELLITSGRSGLGNFVLAQNERISPVDRKKALEAFQDAQLTVYEVYKRRNELDSNGNPIYSESEINNIEDSWENRGYYAVVDYAGDNITSDRNSVIQMRDSLIGDKKTFKEKFGIDEKNYQKAIKDVDAIINGQTTKEDVFKSRRSRDANKAMIDSMKIEGGEITNSKYNNIETLVGVYQNLNQAEASGAYQSKAEIDELAGLKATIANQIIKKIDDGLNYKDVKDEKRGIKYKYKSSSAIAVKDINTYIKRLNRASTFRNLSKDEQDMLKADMYISSLGGLQASGYGQGSEDSYSEKAIMKAHGLALGSYYQIIKETVGYTPYIKNENDPDEVRNAYEEALFLFDNKKSMESIQRQIGIIQ